MTVKAGTAKYSSCRRHFYDSGGGGHCYQLAGYEARGGSNDGTSALLVIIITAVVFVALGAVFAFS
jgi:hypothetical protein